MSETVGCKARRLKESFFEKYISGEGIDIGCGRLYGYSDENRIHESAIAHDKDMCDAHDMSIFEDQKFDYVYSSHVLEHLEDPIKAIKNSNKGAITLRIRDITFSVIIETLLRKLLVIFLILLTASENSLNILANPPNI